VGIWRHDFWTITLSANCQLRDGHVRSRTGREVAPAEIIAS
jgi:hypothetical protein